MTDKPSRNEEEYFAKEEAKRLRKQREEAQAQEEQERRQTHYMKCPKCGADLVTEEYMGVEVDRCPDCKGTWFDAGETEDLLRREDEGVLKVFKSIMRGVGR
jgi:acetyl-CoA carboxylase beta subunit